MATPSTPRFTPTPYAREVQPDSLARLSVRRVWLGFLPLGPPQGTGPARHRLCPHVYKGVRAVALPAYEAPALKFSIIPAACPRFSGARAVTPICVGGAGVPHLPCSGPADLLAPPGGAAVDSVPKLRTLTGSGLSTLSGGAEMTLSLIDLCDKTLTVKRLQRVWIMGLSW